MTEPLDIFGSVMKIKIRLHKLMRLTALLLMPLLSVFDYFAAGMLSTVLALDLWCSLLILILYPLPHEDIQPSLAACAVWVVMVLALKLLVVPPWLLVVAGAMLLFCFMIHRSVCHFGEVPQLFMASTVWNGALDYLCLIHSSAFLFCGVCLCALQSSIAGGWCLLAVFATFFVLQFYRIRTRSTVFLGKKKEKLIKQAQKGAGSNAPVDYVDSDSRSAVLFNDVLRIMETKKPYLQDDFALEDLSRMTRTNRLYLSKAINFHAGRNFNQLLNYYRVRYAVELLKKDEKLRMSEVAEMSGFHSTVSFNMAFKLNEHTTPSEYLRSLKKLT